MNNSSNLVFHFWLKNYNFGSQFVPSACSSMVDTINDIEAPKALNVQLGVPEWTLQ